MWDYIRFSQLFSISAVHNNNNNNNNSNKNNNNNTPMMVNGKEPESDVCLIQK
jgi:hypothetical protein